MIGVPALIGRAANSPMPLIADLRFCHSRFCRCSLVSSPHSFIDRINSERRMSHIILLLRCGEQKDAESSRVAGLETASAQQELSKSASQSVVNNQ